MRAARRKLEPEGALTGATRELQAGLGAFLQICHEHGVKVGPWRLQHVVGEWTFGDHPTYGVITIAHWVCKDGQPWKVGIGLFLGRGPAKPKDLEIKLAALEVEPPVIDHLILLRPEDDLALTGKSKTLWQEAERRGRHARLEPVSLDGFAVLYGFPRWLAALTEALPRRPAAAEPGRPAPGEVREAAGTGVHAGPGSLTVLPDRVHDKPGAILLRQQRKSHKPEVPARFSLAGALGLCASLSCRGNTHAAPGLVVSDGCQDLGSADGASWANALRILHCHRFEWHCVHFNATVPSSMPLDTDPWVSTAG